MRTSTGLVLTLLLAGCSTLSSLTTSHQRPRTVDESAMFGPAAMRIHPIFTQVKDWTGDGRPDGIEALLEFQDQFADPTKVAGTVVFELYDFRKNDPEPRGSRVVNPFLGSILTLEEQKAHWNRTSRTYSFQLSYPQIDPNRTYVLTAMFELAGGGRFFDRMILTPQPQERTSAPTPAGPSIKP